MTIPANALRAHSLSIGRVIQAPVTDVYDAWLDHRIMEIWMKPRPEIVTVARTDPKVGGQLRVSMRMGTREEVHEGTYRLIDRPNRLSFTWSSGSAGDDTIVDVSLLASDGGKTMLLLKHRGLRNRLAEDNHRAGWRRILDRLGETLERTSK